MMEMKFIQELPVFFLSLLLRDDPYAQKKTAPKSGFQFVPANAGTIRYGCFYRL